MSETPLEASARQLIEEWERLQVADEELSAALAAYGQPTLWQRFRAWLRQARP